MPACIVCKQMIQECQPHYECSVCPSWLCMRCYDILANDPRRSCPSLACVDNERRFRYRRIGVRNQPALTAVECHRAQPVTRNAIRPLNRDGVDDLLAGIRRLQPRDLRILTIALVVLVVMGVAKFTLTSTPRAETANFAQPVIQTKTSPSQTELLLDQKASEKTKEWFEFPPWTKGNEKPESKKSTENIKIENFIEDFEQVKRLNTLLVPTEAEITRIIGKN